MATYYSRNLGFIPDSNVDYSKKLNDLMEIWSAPSNEPTILYFSPGKYRFDNNISVKNNISIFGGTSAGLVVFYSNSEKAITLGADENTAINNHFKLKNLIFDNITLRFTGGKKKGVRIRCCAFINSKTPTEVEPNNSRNNAQVDVQNGSFDIRNNVFMRGKEYPGLGINTYKNQNTQIKSNFLGSFKDVEKATPYLAQETINLLKKMEQKKTDLNLSDDEGNYVSAWYATDGLLDSIFINNYFCGNTKQLLYNPKTKIDEIKRDHIIYLKFYNKVKLMQNYFSGWPSDAFGQIKVRNAENLTFIANYLENTSVNARAYDNKDNKNYFLKNTYVLNNFIKEGQINYYQNFTDSDSKSIEIKDFLVFGNRFQAANKSVARIKGDSKNKSKEFYYTAVENIYTDDEQSKPVKAELFQNIEADKLKEKLPTEIVSLLKETWIEPKKV
jgi:hypothetical protein